MLRLCWLRCSVFACVRRGVKGDDMWDIDGVLLAKEALTCVWLRCRGFWRYSRDHWIWLCFACRDSRSSRIRNRHAKLASCIEKHSLELASPLPSPTSHYPRPPHISTPLKPRYAPPPSASQSPPPPIPCVPLTRYQNSTGDTLPRDATLSRLPGFTSRRSRGVKPILPARMEGALVSPGASV